MASHLASSALFLTIFLMFMDLLRLENISKIIKSNYWPSTAMFTKSYLEVPHPHIFWRLPRMMIPSLLWEAIILFVVLLFVPFSFVLLPWTLRKVTPWLYSLSSNGQHEVKPPGDWVLSLLFSSSPYTWALHQTQTSMLCWFLCFNLKQPEWQSQPIPATRLLLSWLKSNQEYIVWKSPSFKCLLGLLQSDHQTAAQH